MRILICIISLLTFGCSMQPLDMAETPTVQLHDLRDLDSDGVIEARDKCENTILGAAIDLFGCPAENTVIATKEVKINFPNNSSVVSSEYDPVILELANFINEHPKAFVTIEGHTSKIGTPKYNKMLSTKRAQHVADILISRFNISSEKITVIGYGSEQMLDEGDFESAHSANRRILAKITSSKQISTDMKWTIYSVDEL